MSEFKMPAVELGDTVFWHLDGDDSVSPTAAIVTELGEQGISLAIVPPGTYNVQPRSGVPHCDDPRVRQMLDHDVGCWQHRDEFEKKQKAKKITERKEAAAAAG